MPVNRIRGLLKPGHHGGRGNCLVCQHQEQATITADLVRGVPLYRLSKRYGINRESLRSHLANHVSPAMASVHQVCDPAKSAVLDKIEELLAEGDRMYEAARAVANMPMALRATAELRALLELKAKITGELDERPAVTVNVQQSSEYITVRNIFFEEAEDYPELRTRISKRLRVLASTGTDPGPAR